jgi:hypothetical protein
MHAWDTYDYGARGYYPAIGRFTSVDPHAEKYYSVSPYAYCKGNPVNAIDPNGMDATDPKPATDQTTAIDNTANKVPQKIEPIQAPPDLVQKEILKTEKSADKNAQLSQTDKMIVTPEDKAVSGNPVVQATVLGVTSAVVAPAIIAAAENVAVAVQGSNFLLPIIGAGAAEGVAKAYGNAPPDTPFLIANPAFQIASGLFGGVTTIYNDNKNSQNKTKIKANGNP